MVKPLKDWTFGEVKKLCQSIEHCYNCELYSGANNCRVAKMVRERPMDWELSEPCTLSEPELAICRAAGAAYVTRDDFSKYVLLWPHGQRPEKHQEPPFGGKYRDVVCGTSPLGKFDAELFPSVRMGDGLEVPDG